MTSTVTCILRLNFELTSINFHKNPGLPNQSLWFLSQGTDQVY